MDVKNVCRKVVHRLMETGREDATYKLIQYVKESMQNAKDLVDVICSEVIRVKPQKPDIFIDCITDDVLKVITYVEILI